MTVASGTIFFAYLAVKAVMYLTACSYVTIALHPHFEHRTLHNFHSVLSDPHDNHLIECVIDHLVQSDIIIFILGNDVDIEEYLPLPQFLVDM